MPKPLCWFMAFAMLVEPPLMSLPRTAFAQPGTFVTPCNDSLFLSLKSKPLDQMSTREYEYFTQKDKECGEFRKLQFQQGAAPTPAIATPLQTTGPAPTATGAEADELAVACERGKIDGQQTPTTGPAVAGFLCGILGFAYAAARAPIVPTTNIMGKSPDYVAKYTICYQDEARKRNMYAACGGWVAGAGVVLLFIAANSNSPTLY